MEHHKPTKNATRAPMPLLSRGCILPLIGFLWVVVITLTVPSGADFYHAPVWLKILVTIGHTEAIAVMLYPLRGKEAANWIASMLVSAWAALQVMVLWYWN